MFMGIKSWLQYKELTSVSSRDIYKENDSREQVRYYDCYLLEWKLSVDKRRTIVCVNQTQCGHV
jgi:hypothetical protein